MKRIKEVEVKEGPAAEVLLRVAKKQKCDVTIMGTHGKGLLTHAFLGSVAEQVLKRSRKSVFIIPLPEEQTATAANGLKAVRHGWGQHSSGRFGYCFTGRVQPVVIRWGDTVGCLSVTGLHCDIF